MTIQKYPVEVKVKDGDVENTVKIYVVKPNNSVTHQAEVYKAKVWQECVKDGVLTRKEVEDVMLKRGIWGKEKGEAEKQILKNIKDLEKQLYLGSGKKMKLSEGKALAIKMREERIHLRDLISEKLAMEQNTAEAICENARFDYIVASCTFYEDGRNVYNGIDDYNSKSADEVAFAAASKLGEILYSLDSKFEHNLPENKWLKKFNLVNDDLSLVNKQGDFVDVDGKKVDKDGYYIDDEGSKVDRDGNPLAEDGTYQLLAEYEDDTVEPVAVVKRNKKNG